jgi:hypothetical protein
MAWRQFSEPARQQGLVWRAGVGLREYAGFRQRAGRVALVRLGVMSGLDG